MKPTKKTTKRQSRFEGQLPDGSCTTNVRKYVAEWRKLARPIEEEFGWTVYGYEPGISFHMGPKESIPLGEWSTGIITFPSSFAIRLSDLIREARAHRHLLSGKCARKHCDVPRVPGTLWCSKHMHCGSRDSCDNLPIVPSPTLGEFLQLPSDHPLHRAESIANKPFADLMRTLKGKK